jgi:DDE superfamily endonuclease
MPIPCPRTSRISLKDVARLAVKMGPGLPHRRWRARAHGDVRAETGGQRAFYSGKHKRHGLNVQTVCSPAGELLWAAAALPGATVDVTAARRAGIAAILTSLTGVLADLGYLGWDKEVITGCRKLRGKDLTAAQRACRLPGGMIAGSPGQAA